MWLEGFICINNSADVANSTLTENQGESALEELVMYNSKAHVINSTLTKNKGEYIGGIQCL